MDTLAAARMELAQPSPSVKHDFQTSLQIQDLIRQGEAALIILYKLTSPAGENQSMKASKQVMVNDSRSDYETASCTQVVSDFCTAAASGLQLLFAGALAPDATTVRLCAETQRDVLRLLDLIHVIDCLKQSLCKEPSKAELEESAAATDKASAHQNPSTAMTPKIGLQHASSSQPLPDDVGPSKEAAVSLLDQQSISSGAAAAQQSSATGPEKGSGYPLGSSEVWGALWGALRLVCRKVAAVPNQQRVSACLAIHAQHTLSAFNRGAVVLLPEERLALLHALPAALFLLFSAEESEAQALEAIGGPKALLKCLQLLRAKPVVCAFGERPMSLLALLQASPYFSNLGAELGKDWALIAPEDLQGKQLAAVESSFGMSRAVEGVKALHAALSAHLTSLAIRMHELGARQRPVPLKVAAEAMSWTEACLKSLSSWAAILLDWHCWRSFLMHADGPVHEDNREPQSAMELRAMLEIMACLQGLAGQLLGEQAWLAPLLQQAVRAQAQNVADLLSAAIEKPSLPRKVLDAADAVRAAIIGWSGAALQGRPQLPEHRSSRLRGLAASVMRASRQRPSLLELAAGGSSSTAHLQGAGEGIQYGVGAAGPTDLQRHMLVCALEALMKEAQPSGMGGLIRQGPLGDSLTRELHALHASVLHWPHLLDLPSSVKQASSMASLGLQQCHSPAPSLTGAGRTGTPLPLQLIRHALASVNSSFPAEHCLLPLALYNQTATLCKERLCCEQMSDAAAAAADAAFEELLNLLSDAVFNHAKKTAAASLSSPHDLTHNTATAIPTDVFQALLRRPGIQLPIGVVSLRADLAPKLALLLASDAAVLVERLSGSCAALPDLEHQIQVLEIAHRDLAASLALPPWSAIWHHPYKQRQQDGCEADQPLPYPSVITERATDAILRLITSQDCRFESTRSCLSSGAAHHLQAPQKAVAHSASATSTPREMGAFGDQQGSGKGATLEPAASSNRINDEEKRAAGEAHADTLGDAELAAFMRLTGPSGVAHLATALTEEARRAVTESYAAIVHVACAVPGDLTGAAADGPAEVCALLTHALTEVPACEDAQRALCALRCLGGAALALLRLEAAASERGVARFMAAAPLLGIGPDERGSLIQPDGSEVTPIAGALFEACADLRLAHASASSDDAAALHTANSLLQQAEEGCWRALEPPQLLPAFLEGLRRELAPILARPPTLDNPSPIPLALSSLLFALGNPDLGIAAPAPAHSAAEAVLAVSPILHHGSQSAGSSEELIGAVHSTAELAGSWRVLQTDANTAAGARLSEAGPSQQSQTRQSELNIAAMLNGTSGSAEEASRGLEGQGEGSPAELARNGGQEMNLRGGAAGLRDESGDESDGESPTRPPAAERMDEVIQQGLELWTPTKSEDGTKGPEAANDVPGQSPSQASEGDDPLPAGSMHVGQQPSGTEDMAADAENVSHCAAALEERPAEQHSRHSADAEIAQAEGPSQQDEDGHSGDAGEHVPEGHGSGEEPAGKQSSGSQKGEHTNMRKWKFKLGGKLAQTEAAAAGDSEKHETAAQSENANHRISAFLGKRLAIFGRSRGASESVSASDEASTPSGLAVPQPSLQQQLKGKQQVVEERPAHPLNGNEAVGVSLQQQPSGSVYVRRSQSEPAGEARPPGRRGYLKKQLTRFGRARGVTDGAEDAASATSGAAGQSGTASRLPGARMFGWGDSAKNQAPKWPGQDLGTPIGEQEGETRLRWPAVGVAPLWGAALLLHTLQLQPHFQLQDICRQLLLEADVAGHSGSSTSTASGVFQCLANLRTLQELMEEAYLSLNARCLD